MLVPVLGWAQAQGRARVIGCRIARTRGAVNLLLDLDRQVDYRTFVLQSPPRVVIDLHGVADWVPPTIDLRDTPVAALRSGPHDGGLRVVLDMRGAGPPQAAFHPSRAGGGGFRVVACLPDPSTPQLAVAAGKTMLEPVRRPAHVVIDPGHGGKDPGAVSASGREEKRVALAIATRLHALLNADPGLRAVMTRDDDHFIPLHDRVLIAHRQKADLFVSIHADAAPDTQARGASVYALSPHGASSAMARWLAESENDADRYAALRDSSLYVPDPTLSRVLVDMSMHATIASSIDLGRILIRHLEAVTLVHQSQVDQAGFAVLKSPDIPSVLVETGFMSNRDDCRRLQDQRHQQELAESIQCGIASYFRLNPLEAGVVA